MSSFQYDNWNSFQIWSAVALYDEFSVLCPGGHNTLNNTFAGGGGVVVFVV